MIEIPAKIITFLKQLEDNGHHAYIVGGAVRDMLMGIEPKDWDIATSAVPGQILETFRYLADVKQINASFPVVMVDGVEIATFRRDIYKDGVTVETVPLQHLDEDLARRDLTINAMAMDKNGHLYDPFCGLPDLEDQLIRFVGDAKERIIEDPCRIVRACRFLALLDGKFDGDTEFDLCNNRHLIKDVSPERIRLEILKTMKYNAASRFFGGMHQIGILKYIFPSLEKTYGADHGQYHTEDVFEHGMIAGDSIPASVKRVPGLKLDDETFALLRLTGYLHDVGKSQPNVKEGAIHFYDHEYIGHDILVHELNALKFSNAEIKYITSLVLVHMRGSQKMSPKTTRKVIKRFVDLNVDWRHWLALKDADRQANRKRANDQPLKVEKIAKKFLHELDDTPYEKGPGAAKPCFEHKQLAISGTTIQKLLGIGPSQLIGVILDHLLKQVIANPSLNTKDKLTALIFGSNTKGSKKLRAKSVRIYSQLKTLSCTDEAMAYPFERTIEEFSRLISNMEK